jgi:hypothetical protein
MSGTGVPRRQVARQFGYRAGVGRAVGGLGSAAEVRAQAGVDVVRTFEVRVRAILAEHPEMPSTVLAERVDWPGSITWFDNVRQLRRDYRRPVRPTG